MKQITRRLLVSTSTIIFLLAACAPAPVAAGNPALDQQLMDQSMALTAAAQNLQAKDQQLTEQSAALTSIAQTAQALPMATPVFSPTVESTAESVQLPSSSDTSETVALPGGASGIPQTGSSPDTDAASPSFPLYATSTPALDGCILTIVEGNSLPTPYSLPTRLPQLENEPYKLGEGSYVIIVNPVNLRSGPSLTNRILMTLNPDPTAVPDPNDPNVVATPIQPTLYRIKTGPIYTDLGGYSANGTAVPKFSYSNRLYKWWQIESVNHAITGWVAEASACGQYYFITPATPTR